MLRRPFAGAPSFHNLNPADQARRCSWRTRHCRRSAPPHLALCPQSHSCVWQAPPVHHSPVQICLPWKQVPVGKAWAGQAEVSGPRWLQHGIQAATIRRHHRPCPAELCLADLIARGPAIGR